MSIKMEMKITGVAELERKLLTLEPKLARKTLMGALRKGAKLFRARARELVPVDKGILKKSIRVRALKKRRFSHGVKVEAGGKGKGGDASHAYMVEGGTTHAPAQPYMRPAFDSEVAAAEKVIADDIARGVESIASK